MSSAMRAVTARLAAARDAAKVISITRHNTGLLDDIAVSTALARLAKLSAGQSIRQRNAMLRQPEASAAISHLEEKVLGFTRRLSTPAPSSRALSASLHSLAALGRPMVLRELQGTMPGLITHWGTRDTSSVVWAYAKSPAAFPGGLADIFEAASLTFREKMASASPQDISTTLWAFAACRHFDPALFDRAATSSRARLADFRPQHLSNTLWAFASNAEFGAVPLFREVQSHAVSNVQRFKPQEVANLLWSFAVAGMLDPELLGQLTPGLGRPDRLSDQSGRALLVSWLAACQNSSRASSSRDSGRPTDELSAELQEAARRGWRRRDGTGPSGTQREVARVIRLLGASATLEAPLPGGYLTADILVKYEDGRTVAVEVDGPSHYSSNRPHRRVGACYLRERLLEGRVTSVVSVPFFEWDGLPGDSARLSYMKAKLQHSS